MSGHLFLIYMKKNEDIQLELFSDYSLDYPLLVKRLGTREFTLAELRRLTGLQNVDQVIENLSLDYTLYNVRRGVYALLRVPRNL